jgi:glycosyltransferase involved in cell wall biosynthesis
MRQFVEDAGIPAIHLEEQFRFDWRVLGAYRRLLLATPSDCLQTHGYKPTIFVALLRAFGQRRPWIAFFHGRTHESRAVRLFDWLAIRGAHLADRIVVVAASQRTFFGRTVPVRHIPNAVTTFPVNGRVAVPRDPTCIIYVGRLSPEKGVDTLICAMHQLRMRRAEVRLEIFGEGPERANLERLITAYALTGVVLLRGHVDDPAPHYARAQVLCLPSRSEGMPNVILEAIAAGTPVVATDVGDVAALVSAELGQVVPPNDAHALTSALDRELSTERGAAFVAAQQQLLARHSRQRRAHLLRALYDEVAGAAD